MKKKEMQAEIDRLWLKLGVLQERVAVLEAQQHLVPQLFPTYPPVTCKGDWTTS